MRTQRILLLEDNGGFAESMIANLFPHKIDLVDNLSSFNSLLYKDPGVKGYDLVLMDLFFHVSPSAWEKLCIRIPEMRREKPCKVKGIPLYGLDYFVGKVLTNPETKDIAETKFVLFSGHARLIRTEKLFEEHGIQFPIERLLDKADGLFDNLSKFINMPD